MLNVPITWRWPCTTNQDGGEFRRRIVCFRGRIWRNFRYVRRRWWI